MVVAVFTEQICSYSFLVSFTVFLMKNIFHENNAIHTSGARSGDSGNASIDCVKNVTKTIIA